MSIQKKQAHHNVNKTENRTNSVILEKESGAAFDIEAKIFTAEITFYCPRPSVYVVGLLHTATAFITYFVFFLYLSPKRWRDSFILLLRARQGGTGDSTIDV